jgi:hypothetical protein
LKLLFNPNDDIAMNRVINIPARGIGAVDGGEVAILAAAKRPLRYLKPFSTRLRKTNSVAPWPPKSRRCDTFLNCCKTTRATHKP